MSCLTLQIIKLSRFPKFYDGDELAFEPGVNVIAGEKDAGKTKWLQMLDYLLGEPGPPEEAFGESLSLRYSGIRGEFKVGAEVVTLERRWNEKGNRTKVFLNGDPIIAEDFSSVILQKLQIPFLRFPKGNPYDDRTWPELSWRMLYRHIYRQERFWSDFAERQPLSEQHACLTQFLGIAEILYPPKFGELIRKQKELERLQIQRENFIQTLQAIAKDLLLQKETTVAVTDEAINATERRLNEELLDIQQRKQKVLDSIKAKQLEVQDTIYRQLQAQRGEFERERGDLLAKRKLAGKRQQELCSYVDVLGRELLRVQRLKTSESVFADSKVTQCPACDQPVVPSTDGEKCYLCGRAHAGPSGSTAAASKRLEFEEEQLQEEKSELAEILSSIHTEISGIDGRIRRAEQELQRADASLAPARDAAAALLPPDWELLSEQEGRLKEQMEQLNRVRGALKQQQTLTDSVTNLTLEEAKLKREIAAETPAIDLAELGQTIQDGMNNYLNQVAKDEPQRWGFGQLAFFLGEKSFQVKVNGRRWDSELGATSQALVLFAYHYALLSLTHRKSFNYPGLVIVDFPVELMDSKTIGGGENYLIEPFVALCDSLGLANSQFIAAGRSFDGLKGAERIKLERAPVDSAGTDPFDAVSD